jgi:hypothetical protein
MNKPIIFGLKSSALLLVGVIIFLLPVSIKGQQLKCSRIINDTLHLCPGTRILIGERQIRIAADTIITGKDIARVFILNDPYVRSKAFYDSLRSAASRRGWSKLAYQLIFPESGEVKPEGPTEDIIQRFTPHQGKRIRRINVLISLPFDTSGGLRGENRLGKLGNSLHHLTQKQVVRRNLMFSEGDIFSSRVAIENAQLLRALPYFSDVRIIPVEVPGEPDQVDITVWVRDVFSLGLEVFFESASRVNFSLYDQNFAGRGHTLYFTTAWHTDRSPNIRIRDIFYNVGNIGSTFIQAGISYLNDVYHEKIGVWAGRDFYASQARFAGGLAFAHHNETKTVYYPFFRLDDIRYNTQELWVGRAFDIQKSVWPLRLVVSASLQNKLYTLRPFVSGDTNKIYYNSSAVLFNIALSRSAFYRGNYIYRFGRIEDVPYGLLAEFTVGPEGYEYYSRTYLGLQLGGARYFEGFGYLSGRWLFSAYNRDGRFEQGQTGLHVEYFSELGVYGALKVRHFATLNYRSGFRRLPGESLNVVKELDLWLLHEKDTLYFSGNKKLTLNYTGMVYTPTFFYGFRMAVFNFANLAFVGESRKFIFSNRLYSGFGIGCMLRNENLVIKTIKLRLGFYPNLPDGRLGVMLQFSGIAPLQFFNYKPRQPKIISYE